jgi:hypothetical protein
MAAQSLGEFLGTIDPRPEDMRQAEGFDSYADLPPTEFCKRILASREFRQYIMNGIVLGDIAPAILLRVMDQGWGRPPSKVELTGKDGQPIETITEVRRVVVPAPRRSALDGDERASVKEMLH